MGAIRTGILGIAITASLAVGNAGTVPDTPAHKTALSTASRVPRERLSLAPCAPLDRRAYPRRLAKVPKPRVYQPTGRGWNTALVSWYGPGLYGNGMAGGGKLTPASMVVAHRTMKFGTRILFKYRGRTCVAVVRDRGPYIYSRMFDLGPGVAKVLRFQGVGVVHWKIIG